MWRWIRNALIVLSLLVFVAGSVFWVRSKTASESVGFDAGVDRPLAIYSTDQRLIIGSSRRRESYKPFDDWEWRYTKQDRWWSFDEFKADTQQYNPFHVSLLGIEYFGRAYDPDEPLTTSGFKNDWCFYLLIIPYWFIVPLSALPPLWWFLRGRRSSKRYRRKHGLCLGCGYDLRGTASDCPECGHGAPSMKPS